MTWGQIHDHENHPVFSLSTENDIKPNHQLSFKIHSRALHMKKVPKHKPNVNYFLEQKST